MKKGSLFNDGCVSSSKKKKKKKKKKKEKNQRPKSQSKPQKVIFEKNKSAKNYIGRNSVDYTVFLKLQTPLSPFLLLFPQKQYHQTFR